MSTYAAIPDAKFQSFEERSDPTQVAPRLAALRARLGEMEIDGFLVPRTDVHQGEYVPDCDARLAYVTGFTGSAGLALVTADIAALFIDSRYTLQAPAQTDTSLVSLHDTTTVNPGEWIAENLPAGSRIGFDPWLHTPGRLASIREPLEKADIALVPVSNPVDAIWTDRPTAPHGPLEVLGNNRTGKSASDKLADLRTTMAREGADAVVLTLPESLCWLFNVRGRDIPHNPFVLGFAVIPAQGNPTLFLADNKLTEENRTALAGTAELADKSDFESALAALAGERKAIWFDPETAPVQVKTILSQGGARLIEKRDPILVPKAKKNEAELAGMREAQKLDGIALAKFLAWFDEAAPRGGLTEIDIVKMLEAFRREEPTAVDVSFETISGSGPNGAIVHYRVSEKSNRSLAPGELMLVDSGAQYLAGTTDITRTMATGPVSEQQKDHFTRVLKGMIAISRARFPKGTTGAQLDILARQFLWQVGLTYNHGTGHGVGAFLSVHEGPAGISPRYTVPFEPGMVLSNEPGFYLEGQYGIRIENLIVVRESEIAPGYLEFETLTLTPIDRRLIAVDMLEPAERDWLDAYHARVAREIGPHLDAPTRAWLEQVTAPL
ncbi:aminopeptidase P family protein [Pelagibacterium sp. H642]|uniref:aminopeptidase P family protein n=1 Tax=Pelagibacterium sp. H642 TaxID=1881069 RepID=UPI00281613F2|nr:aminopeptidase P family protein [Pelagibacterium sp. H642]WMT89894.1 aminopeptidase P family protein [Pelagibacterium sp. H642]